MEVPEKIYCESDGLGNIIKAHNIKWPNDEAENTEYIRKDAFIEKLAEWLKNHHHEYSDWSVDDCELQFKTEEIIKDLKNYIHLL